MCLTSCCRPSASAYSAATLWPYSRPAPAKRALILKKRDPSATRMRRCNDEQDESGRSKNHAECRNEPWGRSRRNNRMTDARIFRRHHGSTFRSKRKRAQALTGHMSDIRSTLDQILAISFSKSSSEISNGGPTPVSRITVHAILAGGLPGRASLREACRPAGRCTDNRPHAPGVRRVVGQAGSPGHVLPGKPDWPPCRASGQIFGPSQIYSEGPLILDHSG